MKEIDFVENILNTFEERVSIAVAAISHKCFQIQEKKNSIKFQLEKLKEDSSAIKKELSTLRGKLQLIKTNPQDANLSFLEVELEDAGFSTRTFNSLLNGSICSMRDLYLTSAETALSLRNLGTKGVEEISKKFLSHGLVWETSFKIKKMERIEKK